MKQLRISIRILIFFLLLTPVAVMAYPHGYKRQTDEIYAIARHDLSVYYDESEDDLIEYIPSFTGIKVIEIDGSWRRIEYRIKNEVKEGWITSGDFYSDCLIYDGRDKQIMADGDYLFQWKNNLSEEQKKLDDSSSENAGSNDFFTARVVYTGTDSFTIERTDTNQYLRSPIFLGQKASHKVWGSQKNAGSFRLVRTGAIYKIQDILTGRCLVLDTDGQFRFNQTNDDDEAGFRVTRTCGKVLDQTNLKLFAQFDADWAKDYYGRGKNDDPESNNFCTSGCGIFSTLNAIYTLTGQYIDPHILADYAVKKEYRVEDNGTDSEFFKAAAGKFGSDYGFRFDGESGSIGDLKKKLKEGKVAIGHVPGHYVAIVDYNPKTKKYLLLDSHYLPKRETCPYGDWVSRSVLEESDNLRSYMLYFYALTD